MFQTSRSIICFLYAAVQESFHSSQPLQSIKNSPKEGLIDFAE